MTDARSLGQTMSGEHSPLIATTCGVQPPYPMGDDEGNEKLHPREHHTCRKSSEPDFFWPAIH